mmetsp:Transcript_4692/g.12868  ORF Transcript_4692/g.12868 Transcript_4692/m.12868 type:complete len:115 (-) Transcript_4692:2088-2432(-)
MAWLRSGKRRTGSTCCSCFTSTTATLQFYTMQHAASHELLQACSAFLTLGLQGIPAHTDRPQTTLVKTNTPVALMLQQQAFYSDSSIAASSFILPKFFLIGLQTSPKKCDGEYT